MSKNKLTNPSLTVLSLAIALLLSIGANQATAQSRREGFLRNQLSGRCLDVAGSPGVNHGANVQLGNCEFSGQSGGGNTDQRWELLTGGYIRNQLSGKCLDVAGHGAVDNGTNVQLANCELSGQSGNGSPTDQRWELLRGGYIRNQLSGRCIDVAGEQHGANVQLTNCELSGYRHDGAVTDHRWEFVSGQTSSGSRSSSQSSALLNINSSLSTSSFQTNDNYYVALHEFEGRRGQSVTISLNSSDFDTKLFLVSGQQQKLGENDDVSSGNTNSRIQVTLPYTGKFYILVTSYEARDTGSYQLTVR